MSKKEVVQELKRLLELYAISPSDSEDEVKSIIVYAAMLVGMES